MREQIEEILVRVCGSEEVRERGIDLLESGLLDSLAMIDLLFELEELGVELQPTQVKRHCFCTVESICRLVEDERKKGI